VNDPADELHRRLQSLLAAGGELTAADVPVVGRAGAWDELRETYDDLASARRQCTRWLAVPVTAFSGADELRDELERVAAVWVDARLRMAVERYLT